MTSTTTLKETPLAACHRELGAKMVDFAGWNMPVQYKSIIAEHMATRQKAGIFDVSHMGEFIVQGPQAFEFIQHVIANDLNKLEAGDCALYSQLCYEDGGTVDDLIVYKRKAENDFLLVVNASNIEKDWAWLQKNKGAYDCTLTDISDKTSLIALQGPNAETILAKIAGDSVKQIPFFGYGRATVDGVAFSFGRTGYTGEDGFEIFVSNDKAAWLWGRLLQDGAEHGVEACGLGARDTLRLEAGLPLYGHELDTDISPIESGLGWSVKPEKGDFIGQKPLAEQKAGQVQRKMVCLKGEGKAAPRQGYAVFDGDKQVGIVTSGAPGVYVGYPIAFALVDKAWAKVGTDLTIAIRDNKVKAQVVSRPWYKASKK